jgi:hypothetical protein
MYVYEQTEFAGRDGATNHLYTVGHYDPTGKWHSESDHSTREQAAARVRWLHGALAAEFAGQD